MPKNRSMAVVVGFLAISWLFPAAFAADEKNRFRFGAVFASPTGDLTVDGFFVEDVDPDTRLEFQGSLGIEADGALGYWLAYERLFTERVGMEVTLLGSDHDVDGTLDGTLFLIDNPTGTILEQEALRETERIGDIAIMPLTIGANFHLTPRRPFDLYAGPFAAFVSYDDLELIGEESIAIDDDVAFGAVVGIDVPFGGGSWYFSGAARYLSTEADPKGSGPDDHPLDVNPWFVQVGVGRRF